MLLTGFDAKIEDGMYLDRPLKEHTLLQAIARVNRTYSKEIKELSETGEEIIRTKTKTYGYVVDYFVGALVYKSKIGFVWDYGCYVTAVLFRVCFDPVVAVLFLSYRL
jgi:hypothetical protein